MSFSLKIPISCQALTSLIKGYELEPWGRNFVVFCLFSLEKTLKSHIKSYIFEFFTENSLFCQAMTSLIEGYELEPRKRNFIVFCIFPLEKTLKSHIKSYISSYFAYFRWKKHWKAILRANLWVFHRQFLSSQAFIINGT